MQQFFIEDILQPFLSADQIHQCKHVLRMKKGDRIRLVDKSRNGVISEFTDDNLSSIRAVAPIEFPTSKVKLTLITSMIRSERLEWMIQKACECGVDRIVLYQSDNGVVRDFGKRADRKMERLNLIAKEACEQSYRDHSVEILGPVSFKELDAFRGDLNLYADLGDNEHFLKMIPDDVQTISVIVGPEGGFSKKEQKNFEELEFIQTSLGNTVLRAETASIYICNMISAYEVIK